MSPRARWCRLSGHNLASWNAAGRRWTLSGNCEPLIRLRRNRARPLPVGSCSDYRAALLLPASASSTDSPSSCGSLGLSIRPLSVAASLAALTLTPSLPHSPSPLCLSHIPLLPLPSSSLTLLPAFVPQISSLHAPERGAPRSARCGDGLPCSRSDLRATRAQSRSRARCVAARFSDSSAAADGIDPYSWA